MGAGWASVATSGLDRVRVQGWLTARVNPRCDVGPHLEFSTMLNGAVRAQLARPSFVLFGLSTGVEF